MDFIKYKVLLRTIIGSIIPFCALGLAHLCQGISGKTFISTSPNYALYITIAFSLYPLNYISLKLLFSLIDFGINSKIRIDPNSYPTLRGNYAPVHHEQ